VNPLGLLALLVDLETFTWRELVDAARKGEPEIMKGLKDKENEGGGGLAGEFQALLALNLIEPIDPLGPDPSDPDYTPQEFRLSDSGKEVVRDYVRVTTN
jgi:hypothetical protein